MARAETHVGRRRSESREAADPVLLMLGVGRHLWAAEPGDAFVERLRSEALADPPTSNSDLGADLNEAVWLRIRSHQGEEFHTATSLPFTYEVEGLGIWFFRQGRRINRKLARIQVETAISRCPLNSTTEIKDLMDYAYLYGLLMDRRIRSEAW
jgi:hypothetical protein